MQSKRRKKVMTLESKRRYKNTICMRAENIFKSSLPWLGRDEIENSRVSEDAPVLRLAAKTLWTTGTKRNGVTAPDLYGDRGRVLLERK